MLAAKKGLGPFLRHKPDCTRWVYGDLPCTCGLHDALDALDAVLRLSSSETSQ